MMSDLRISCRCWDQLEFLVAENDARGSFELGAVVLQEALGSGWDSTLEGFRIWDLDLLFDALHRIATSKIRGGVGLGFACSNVQSARKGGGISKSSDSIIMSCFDALEGALMLLACLTHSRNCRSSRLRVVMA